MSRKLGSLTSLWAGKLFLIKVLLLGLKRTLLILSAVRASSLILVRRAAIFLVVLTRVRVCASSGVPGKRLVLVLLKI